jgi:two-component system sporulation sensor kinase B
MSLPFRIANGFILDLRYIPFIVGALYLGFPAAIFAFITIISYRFFLNVDGIYSTLFIFTIMLFIIPLLKPHYLKLRRQKRVLFSSLIALLSSLFSFIFVLFINNFSFGDYSRLLLSFILIQTISMYFITYFIEEMAYNKKMKEKLLNSEKLTIISDLSASISHEIRNPLTVTTGFLQLLYQNDLSSQKKKQYLDLSLMELKRAEEIISDFLSLTKNKLAVNTSINVIKEIHYAVNIITPYALMNQVDIKMGADVEEDVWVKGDPTKFQQSLINLVKNSIEAMPDGGNLVINCSKDNHKVIIQIKDTGTGMSKEEISKLGSLYYTTKTKGTGLGTTLIYSTVNSMKGTIDVESEKGKGTTFSLTLPIDLREVKEKFYYS